MILKVSLLVIGLCANVALSVSIDCDTEQCAKPSKLYEELGCKAVYGSRSCCAKRFECPDFKKLDDNKCMFEGKEYKIGEILPRTDASNTKCVETCFCTRQNNEPAKFTCKNSDCGISNLNEPGCLNIYGDLNECCSTSIVCDEAEKETLASCFIGREYREGEKFIPESNPCYECLCHKDFDNTTITDNPHCRKLNCEIDLRYKSFVQRGCLPVFHSEKCCPVDWECPTKLVKKVIKRSVDDDETQTAKQTVFIVTPSKNLEGFLSEVKSANPDDSSSEESYIISSTTTASTTEASTTEASTTTVTTTTEALPTVVVTEPTSIPTISSDPFLLPFETTANILIEKEEEKPTTQPKVLIEPESSTAAVETTQAPTTSTEASTTTVATTFEKLEVTSEPLTAPPTIVTTITSTSAEPSTTESTTTKKSDDYYDSSESKESGENTNLFGETVEEKNEKVSETTILSIVELATEVSSTSIETTQSPPTTETVTEAAKVLEQPEEVTTLAPETTTVIATSETATTPEATTTSEASTEPVTVATTYEVPLTTQQTTVSLALSSQEVSVQTPTSETPKVEVTQESTTPTAQTLSENVFPTEFEKLLTTLREFVSQADSLTSTAAPSTSTTTTEAIKVDQQVESESFSVSTDKLNEEATPIRKRSVRDADFNPAYYKQHFLSSKENVCVYNGRTFKVGEIIRTDNECLKCTCEYAPIGHCILKEKCNYY